MVYAFLRPCLQDVVPEERVKDWNHFFLNGALFFSTGGGRARKSTARLALDSFDSSMIPSFF